MRYPLMRRSGRVLAATLMIIGGTAACGMVMHHLGIPNMPVPAESEFGLGPRTSSSGTYVARLMPQAALKVGPMQSVPFSLTDRDGRAVSGAEVAIDGGMPQHGHGLPTKPRVAAGSEAGSYVVAGLRFNMGGWWVVRLTITAAAGTDSVTFNVRL